MKILVKRTGALGDVIETTPIIARLRAENPDAVIDIDTQYPQVFYGNPHVSHAVPASDYDRIIDLDGAFERAMRKLHPIDAYSEVAFGDRKTPHRLEFKSAGDTSVEDRRIVIHPAKSWPIRTLPWAWWQKLIQLLDYADYQVVITGTFQDHGGFGGAVDLRQKMSLAEQAQLIAASGCFICSESGPMILAQTTMTPVIALLTMVPPEHVMHDGCGPFHAVRADMPCVGCAAEQPAETTYFDCKFGHRKCVTAFDAAAVAALVGTLA